MNSSSTLPISLQFIRDAAIGEFNFSCVSSSTKLLIDFVVLRNDGQKIVFNIEVFDEAGKLGVKESTPCILPEFCPNRHINKGGTFCLGWNDTESDDICDKSSAQLWLSKVHRFLELQLRAQNKKKWVGEKEWAHGKAAQYQHQVECLLKELNSTYLQSAYDSGELSVELVTGSRRERLFRLKSKGTHIYTAWISTKTTSGRNRTCLCGCSIKRKRHKLRKCSVHAKVLYELIQSLWNMFEEDERFWRFFHGSLCCKTLEKCRLME
jgi:hypothetical protein